MSTPAEPEIEIHRRLLSGDPTAPADLAQSYLETLVRRLRSRFPSISDDHILHDAAVEALFNYIEQPSRFDPARSNLLNYLTMSARGDLLNNLARQKLRRSREISLEAVEQSPWPRNIVVESNGVAEGPDLDGPGSGDLLQRVLEVVPDPRDQQLLQLMLEGERHTEAFSALMGIQHLDLAEQRKTVKRHKDRLKKRLERLGVKLRERAVE